MTAMIDHRSPSCLKLNPTRRKRSSRKRPRLCRPQNRSLTRLRKPSWQSTAINWLRSGVRLGHEKLLKATGEDVSWLGELQFLGGDADEGIKTVEETSRTAAKRSHSAGPIGLSCNIKMVTSNCPRKTFERLRDVVGINGLGQFRCSLDCSRLRIRWNWAHVAKAL